MAFDINKYFKTKGGNIENSVEGIREAAEAILSAGKGYSKNSAYLGWATEALNKLEQYEEVGPGVKISSNRDTLSDSYLNDAYDWIVGSKQSHRASKVWSGYKDTISDIRENIAEYAAHLANLGDFSGIDERTGKPFTEEEKQLKFNSKYYQETAEKLAHYQELAQKFGTEIDTKNLLVRTESGFIPANEVSTVTKKTTTTESVGQTSTRSFTGLTDKQVSELDTASARIANGTGTDTDRANVDYATKTFGYTTPTGGTTNTSTFTGTPEQKQGLDAAASRLASGTANYIDKTNLEYAKNNLGYSYSAGTTVAPAVASQSGTLTPEQKAELDATYNRAGGQTATDLANIEYATKNFGYTPPTTTTATPATTSPTGAVSDATGATSATGTATDATAAAYAIIDAAGLPSDLTALFKSTVDNYGGTEVDAQEVLSTWAKIKESTIDPYYKGLIDVATQDVTNTLTNLQRQRELQVESERTTAGQNIRQAKAGLEKAGLTFTGQGIESLGAESAYAQAPAEGVVTPTQEAYGGQFYEGSTNQYNRLLASSSQATYENAMKNLANATVSTLGSEATGALGIPGADVVQGVQGDMATQKQADYASKFSEILSNYYDKYNLNTQSDYENQYQSENYS